MGELKLTKSELRLQQQKLTQLEKYLPTLHLKKSLLQTQLNEVRAEIRDLERSFHESRLSVSEAAGLLSVNFGFKITDSAKIAKVVKHYENIAGVSIPIFEKVEFAPFEYSLFDTPAYLESLIQLLRHMTIAKAKLQVAEEKKGAIAKELREVTIRVNLFEKNLIPNAKKNIQKIRVFLGDQQLAAIAQAKVAKQKIEKAKKKQLLLTNVTSKDPA